MPMLLPPPSIGAGMGGMGAGQPPSMQGPPTAPPSYGGTEALLSQPSGNDMSNPQALIATVLQKIKDLLEATNLSFPGGEEKITEGLQQIAVGLNEKIQRMGMTEPQGPPTAA